MRNRKPVLPPAPPTLESIFKARTFAVVSKGCLDQLRTGVQSTESCVRQMRPPEDDTERSIHEQIVNGLAVLKSAKADLERAYEARKAAR